MYSIFCQTYANVGILFQTGKHLRSILPLFVVQSVFLHFSVQRRRINVQHLRRPFPVARAYFQGPDDGLFFLCLIFRKRKIFSFSSSILMFKQAVSIIGCLDSRTARLILFCNSRTFPGQPYESSCCSASRLNPSVCRLSSLETFP